MNALRSALGRHPILTLVVMVWAILLIAAVALMALSTPR